MWQYLYILLQIMTTDAVEFWYNLVKIYVDRK